MGKNTEPAATSQDSVVLSVESTATRIPIIHVSPAAYDNIWCPKAFSGEVVPFRATVFREGHDLIGVALLLTDPEGSVSQHPLIPIAPGTDRWETWVQLRAEGIWEFRINAYSDDYATWLRNAQIKIPAGLDTQIMLAQGQNLLAAAAEQTSRSRAERTLFTKAATLIAAKEYSVEERFLAASTSQIIDAMMTTPLSALSSFSRPHRLEVERTRAGVGSWYEFFPRSEGAKKRRDGSWKSGTFRTAAKRLPAIAEMGFDVVYLPPIHPIGHSFRKGPDNTLTAGVNDPGSPWAIGSSEGGHDAIHPQLGGEDDLRFFIRSAARLGIEVALDLALQASPDHPWVTEHPEWFTHLPDGSIAYAENPPKKYQDIYPINFDNDEEGLRHEVLRIVRHWINLGIRIFRVDNPHTKPIHFWEWLIRTVRASDPDVVFLAEAFTRPAILKTLAAVGFQQSYTYFTWRNTKGELEEFLSSLAEETADFLRPNLFVNTPDILTEYLQFGGRAAFKIRAAIAGTAAPSWGVYSGYELCESVARPGSEEYISNEKYEYRPRDYTRALEEHSSLQPYLTLINTVRSDHPALRQLRNLHIHRSDDDSVLVYSKHLSGRFTTDGTDDTIIVVANVDPHNARETMVHLDLTVLDLRGDESFGVTDVVTGQQWKWRADNYVRLDPTSEPVHILVVNRGEGAQ